MDKFIPVNEPSLGKREKDLLIECVETGWVSSEGPFVEKFEESLVKKLIENMEFLVLVGQQH